MGPRICLISFEAVSMGIRRKKLEAKVKVLPITALAITVTTSTWALGAPEGAGGSGGGGTQLVTMIVTFLIIIGVMIGRPLFAVLISRWARRLGRDGVAWGLMAGFISVVLMAIILAILGKKRGAESFVIQLDGEKKKALELKFQTLGLDFESGIRMVVYKWLEEQKLT
jgi:hypothetical protein